MAALDVIALDTQARMASTDREGESGYSRFARRPFQRGTAGVQLVPVLDNRRDFGLAKSAGTQGGQVIRRGCEPGERQSSDRQTFALTRTPCVNDFLSVAGTHAHQKAVRSLAFNATRLIGSFHC